MLSERILNGEPGASAVDDVPGAEDGTHTAHTKPASCSRAAIAKTLLALAFLGLIAGAATLGVTGIGPWPGLTIHKKAPSTHKLASVGELDLHATLNNTAAPDPKDPAVSPMLTAGAADAQQCSFNIKSLYCSAHCDAANAYEQCVYNMACSETNRCDLMNFWDSNGDVTVGPGGCESDCRDTQAQIESLLPGGLCSCDLQCSTRFDNCGGDGDDSEIVFGTTTAKQLAGDAFPFAVVGTIFMVVHGLLFMGTPWSRPYFLGVVKLLNDPDSSKKLLGLLGVKSGSCSFAVPLAFIVVNIVRGVLFLFDKLTGAMFVLGWTTCFASLLCWALFPGQGERLF